MLNYFLKIKLRVKRDEPNNRRKKLVFLLLVKESIDSHVFL